MLNLNNITHYCGYLIAKTSSGVTFTAVDHDDGFQQHGCLPSIEAAIKRIDEIKERGNHFDEKSV